MYLCSAFYIQQGGEDKAYRALARKRTEASQQRGRTVEVITDIKESKKLQRGNLEPLWSKDRVVRGSGRAGKQGGGGEAGGRTMMDRQRGREENGRTRRRRVKGL